MKGCIHERTNAKGKKIYCLVYWTGRGDKKHRKWETLPEGIKKKEAQGILAERVTEVRQNKYVGSDITFAAFADEWLKRMQAKVENK